MNRTATKVAGKIMNKNVVESDILVIGSGISGLFFSIKASEYATVNIITKTNITESSTFYAQGGIAAVFNKKDTFKKHIKDTLIAGAGLCDEEVVENIITSGPDLITDLINLGVKFTKRKENPAEFDLTKEGGHTERRILHSKDLTGREIENKLVNNISKNIRIKVYDYHIAINLVWNRNLLSPKCFGAYVLDIKGNIIKTFLAKYVVLATGGSGKVYLYTSNPDIATGDGIAMAYRIGATVSNLEFMQFHPTCLFHPEAKSFLISESVRGEGGILRLKNGKTFMENYHYMKSLAPRDIVARAIDFEMKKSGDDYVLLDITHKSPEYLKERFPYIYKNLKKYGFDLTKMPLPVVPAAHYMCGGVKVDKNGKSDVENLFVIGESACSGLHGANRLASNSLLEALFLAKNASLEISKSIDSKIINKKVHEWSALKAVSPSESVMVSHNWDEIRHLMWNYVGIVRSNKRLERALRRTELLKKEVDEYYWNFKLTVDLIELRNILVLAELIINSAMLRKESRGLNYNIDYPERNDNKYKIPTELKKSK